MRKMTTIDLIAFSPDAHEVGTDPVSTRRTVKAQEMSLTLTEQYQAAGTGLSPEAKLLIPYDRDYQGERELDYNGERWMVIKADPYKEWNGILLSIRRKLGNSGDATPPVTPSVNTGTEVG